MLNCKSSFCYCCLLIKYFGEILFSQLNKSQLRNILSHHSDLHEHLTLYIAPIFILLFYSFRAFVSQKQTEGNTNIRHT